MAQHTQSSVDLILGTAGHIDHGKSTLVQALCGTDPDRLAEEKRRGITITLGFAQLVLPNGRTMGVVDVPGHEKFVKQMIAGATGIDVALLVIAADDGVMPQTIEHEAVLETLGISSCVVALTKADAVDAEWLEFMRGEVETWLASTAYTGAPIVAVSAREKTGLDELKQAIATVASTAHRHVTDGRLRYPVDRAFTIKGAGTVVTGTLWSGVTHTGDTVEILPSKKLARIRSVQMHDIPVDQAPAGNRVALNLANIKTDEVQPGTFLAAPGLVTPTDRFDARLTYLDTAGTHKPLFSGTRMHIAHGTQEVLGRVLLCNAKESLAPGETCYVQIRLEEPLPISAHDRFIVRTYSPVSVAGGGIALMANPHRRTRLDRNAMSLLDAVARDDDTQAIQIAVASSKEPVTAHFVAHYIGLDPQNVVHTLSELATHKDILEVGTISADTSADATDETRTLYATKSLVQRIASMIERQLITFHNAHPTERGISKDELHALVAPHMDGDRFKALLAHAVLLGKAHVSSGLVSHPSSQGAADAAEEDAQAAIMNVLNTSGMTPEILSYLLPKAVPNVSLAARALAELEKSGRVIRVSKDLCFSAQIFNQHVDAVRNYLRANTHASVAELKEPLETSRKYAVPILEYLDAHHITKRDGNERTLVE